MGSQLHTGTNHLPGERAVGWDSIQMTDQKRWDEETSTSAFGSLLSCCRKGRLEIPALSNSSLPSSQLGRSCIVNVKLVLVVQRGLGAHKVLIWDLNLCASCAYLRVKRQTV